MWKPSDKEVREALREAQESLDKELAKLSRQIGHGSQETLAIRTTI